MHAAGYVLAGGASSRMGRDKAFLMLGGRTLLEIAAAAVCEAAGSVTIIGPPDRFAGLELRVIPDRRPQAGPLAGIETALLDATSDWSLIVACDMPRLNAGTLRRVLEETVSHPDSGCILPESAAGWAEPLCAAYHKRTLPAITAALDAGTRKVTRALPSRLVHHVRMTDDPIFQNINTPEEWSELSHVLEP
jgi:molybdopterin-guanine dinucleotide biosynthesis protein A